MSDDEDDFNMYESGGEDEDDLEDAGVEIENQYYESKEEAETSLERCLKGLEKVLELEEEKGKWGFKALKRMVKIHHQLGNHDKVLECYKKLMTYTKKAVTMNESEKAIHSLLDHLSNSPIITDIDETTLTALKEAKNEKVYLRLQLRMAKILLETKNHAKLEKTLKELYQSCKLEDGTDDPSKASQFIEILALEIQMHTDRGGSLAKLKELYDKATTIKSAINAPSITGIIHECGGKMWMREHRWNEAYKDLFQAFNEYDEDGNKKAAQCLKYLVLANMLSSSQINPFAEPRAKAFQSKEEIQAFTNLIEAYQRQDINEFEKILNQNKKSILEDEFMRNYIEDLLTNIRTHVLLKLIKPYNSIRLPFISLELNIPPQEVEGLLVSLILDRQISGKIDQVQQVLNLEPAKSSTAKSRYSAISKWSHQLVVLQQSVSSRLNS